MQSSIIVPDTEIIRPKNTFTIAYGEERKTLAIPSNIDPRTVPYIPPRTVAKWHNPKPLQASLLDKRISARYLRGPIGSAKTTGLVKDPYIQAHLATPCNDGIRRTRAVFLRNTYPELKSTTIESWENWFGPDAGYPSVVFSSPIRWQFEWRYSDAPPVRLEVWFLSIDRPSDVKKLRGLETTWGYGSEGAELPYEAIEMLSGRCGRYPSAKFRPAHVPKDQWPSAYGMAMESNSPSDQNWWYELEVEKQPANAEFYRQPGGLEPDAENLDYLPGGRNYYSSEMQGKSENWIKAYIHNQFSTITSGLPVWPEFNRGLHVSREPLELLQGLPMWWIFDFGLTPACLVGQVTKFGQLRCLREIVTSIKTKASSGQRDKDGLLPGQKTIPSFMKEMVLPVVAEYAKTPGIEFRGTCDPSGSYTTSTGKSEIFYVQQHLPFVNPARSNVFIDRKTAVADKLTMLVGGEPGIIIDPSCKTLIRGMEGQFCLEQKMISTAQGLRYKLEPDKQEQTSHICDDLGYFALENSDNVNATKLPPPRDLTPADPAFGR